MPARAALRIVSTCHMQIEQKNLLAACLQVQELIAMAVVSRTSMYEYARNLASSPSSTPCEHD